MNRSTRLYLALIVAVFGALFVLAPESAWTIYLIGPAATFCISTLLLFKPHLVSKRTAENNAAAVASFGPHFILFALTSATALGLVLLGLAGFTKLATAISFLVAFLMLGSFFAVRATGEKADSISPQAATNFARMNALLTQLDLAATAHSGTPEAEALGALIEQLRYAPTSSKASVEIEDELFVLAQAMAKPAELTAERLAEMDKLVRARALLLRASRSGTSEL